MNDTKTLRLGMYTDARLREAASRLIDELPVTVSGASDEPKTLGSEKTLNQYRMHAMLAIENVLQHPDLKDAHQRTRSAVVEYMLEMIRNDWQLDYADKPITPRLAQKINTTERAWPEMDKVIALNKVMHEPIHSDDGIFDFVEAYDFRCEQALELLAEIEGEEGIYPLRGAMRSQASRILNEIIEARTGDLAELDEEDFIQLAKFTLINAITFDADPELFYEKFGLESGVMTLMIEEMRNEANKEPVDIEQDMLKAQIAEQLLVKALGTAGKYHVTVDASVVPEFPPDTPTMQLPITHIPALKPMMDEFTAKMSDLMMEEWFMDMTTATKLAMVDFYTGWFLEEVDFSLDNQVVTKELVEEMNQAPIDFRQLGFYRKLYTTLFEPYSIEVDLWHGDHISDADELMMRFDDALQLVAESGYDEEQAVELHPPFSDELKAKTAEVLKELALASSHELEDLELAQIAHLGLEVLNKAIDYSERMAVAESQDPPRPISAEGFYQSCNFNSTFMQDLIKERRDRLEVMSEEPLDGKEIGEKQRAFDAELSTPETALSDYINQYVSKLIRTDYQIAALTDESDEMDYHKELEPFQFNINQSLKKAVQRNNLTIDDLPYFSKALETIGVIFPHIVDSNTHPQPSQKDTTIRLQAKSLFEDLTGFLSGSPSAFDDYIDAVLAIEYPVSADLDVTGEEPHLITDAHAKRSRVFAMAKAFNMHGETIFEQFSKFQPSRHYDFDARVSAVYDVANELSNARFSEAGKPPYSEETYVDTMRDAIMVALRPDLDIEQVKAFYTPESLHNTVALHAETLPTNTVKDISHLMATSRMPSRAVH